VTLYNDNDPRAAQWLRTLIEQGHITNGSVSTASITDINPSDLAGHERVHLFAGIGGWDYALKLAGWPDDLPVWTGSCPCQPFSDEGRRKGVEDERHLWPEMRRLIAECRPPVVFGEQVASKAGRGWLAGVRADLEALGYRVGAADLCAAGVASPHIRQRLFWVADAGCAGDERGLRRGEAHRAACANEREARQRERGGPNGGGGGVFVGVGDAGVARLEGLAGNGDGRDKPGRVVASQGGPIAEAGAPGWDRYELVWCRDPRGGPPLPRRIEPGTFPLADGVPARVGRLRGYGNAIVPQVAAEFVRAYMEERDDVG
jgi:DNA (cytosine-5)-methyltransferase 1